jgi:hypothetical protein
VWQEDLNSSNFLKFKAQIGERQPDEINETSKAIADDSQTTRKTNVRTVVERSSAVTTMLTLSTEYKPRESQTRAIAKELTAYVQQATMSLKHLTGQRTSPGCS